MPYLSKLMYLCARSCWSMPSLRSGMAMILFVQCYTGATELLTGVPEPRSIRDAGPGVSICASIFHSTLAYRANTRNKAIAHIQTRRAATAPSGIHHKAMTPTAISTDAALTHRPVIDGKNGATRNANTIMLPDETITASAYAITAPVQTPVGP